jgi:hypothetical protein
VRSTVRLDLVGQTRLARLHLRVRFGITDDSANVESTVPTLSIGLRADLDVWSGGIE